MLLRKFFYTAGLFIFAATSVVFGQDFYGSNRNSQTSFSETTREFGLTSLMGAALENDYEAVSVFISSGAVVNAKNTGGATALHLAARSGSYESAKLLIENGAEVNAKDREGWTPLMRAALAGDVRTLGALLDSGADVWTQNKWNETALLHSAVSNCTECTRLIIEKTRQNGKYSSSSPMRQQTKESIPIANSRYNKEMVDLLNGFIGSIDNPATYIGEDTPPLAAVTTVEDYPLEKTKVPRIVYILNSPERAAGSK